MNSITESLIQQQAQSIHKEYLQLEDLIQRSRNFIYSELSMTKYTNITLEKERKIFSIIIGNVEDLSYRDELLRVKQVFFQLIKDQMLNFQKILARHMDLLENINYSQMIKSKLLKQLQKQKDSLLHYLLSSDEEDNSCKSKNSTQVKSSSSLKEMKSFSFASEKQSKRSFRTLPDDDEEESDGVNYKSQKSVFAI